jgi:hypothetical protein
MEQRGFGDARALMRAVILVCAGVAAGALPVRSQKVNMFPADAEKQWTRIAIPPTHPVSDVAQWHIDAKKRTIVCDGNGGHEWLRFNHELGDFTFHVKWKFTPLSGTPKYNSGVFFRNNEDGSIWNQAQTSLAGGYIFGLAMVDGKLTRYNLQKDMKENRVKPAGEWNVYDIRCAAATCTLAVNGEVVNTVQTGGTRGYVGLEAEGYQIKFTDFRLTERK